MEALLTERGRIATEALVAERGPEVVRGVGLATTVAFDSLDQAE
jgi:hypothetical protein